MSKKTLDMVAMDTKKANAQNMTCFITFIAAVTLAIGLFIVACALPIITDVTEITCWISMGLEAIAVCRGFVAYWIKRNAL